MHCSVRRTSLAGALVVLVPSAAVAHVGVQTIELLAGALHPWMNLESGLTLAALALWMAQGARSTDVAPFLGIALCVAAGVAIGDSLASPAPPWLIHLVALAAGSCVSLGFAPRSRFKVVACGAMALAAGYVAGVDAAADVRSPWFFAAGVFAGGLVVPLAVAALIVEREAGWIRIAVRILGSWIAAVSLMLLALKLRG